jgi:hypothetical protein
MGSPPCRSSAPLGAAAINERRALAPVPVLETFALRHEPLNESLLLLGVGRARPQQPRYERTQGTAFPRVDCLSQPLAAMPLDKHVELVGLAPE